MRVAVLSAAWLALGCSASELDLFGGPDEERRAPADASSSAEASPGDASTSADEPIETPDDDAQEAAPPPLTWSAVSANIIEGDIVSIWGSGAANVYVGTDMQSVYLITNGSSMWTGVPSQVVGGGWSGGAGSAYAVGASAWLAQTGMASAGGLFQYTGDQAWKEVTSGTLYSAWGSSPVDLYVVGDPGVMHSTDGATFVTESSAGTGALSVWGSGPDDVYMGSSAATATILHSAGDGTWEQVYTEGGAEAWAVWSGEPGDAYAIVVPAGMANPPAHVVHASKGHGWTSEPVGDGTITLVALWGSGAGDVYAGGWHLDSAGKGGDLFHSTGDGRWTRVTLPGSPYDVRCVWGSSATDVYVGVFDTEDGPVLLHGKP